MAAVKKRDRDKAMQIICDFFEGRPPNHHISPEYLTYKGLSKDANPEHVVKVLASMGYLTYEMVPNKERTAKCIGLVELTDAGKCYFEKKADKTHEKRVENIRYIITTAIAVAALITAIVSIYLQYR